MHRNRHLIPALGSALLLLASACTDPATEGSGGAADGTTTIDTATADGSATADTTTDAAKAADTGAKSNADVPKGDGSGPADATFDAGPSCATDDDCVKILGDTGPCATAKCDATTGTCVKEPVANDTPCDDADACTEGTMCKDGLCDAETGTAVSCDDSDPCTVDTCDPTAGCKSEPSDGPCDDGNPCTTADSCATGTCKGKPKSCDDGDPCTADACDPAEGCTTIPTTGPCDDGDSCTTNDFCKDGVCTGGEAACPTCEASAECEQDDDLCNGDTACIGGFCKPDPATAIVCDTSQDTGCKVTACEPATGACETTEIADGGACNDGNGCTKGEKCVGGVCGGGAVVCTPGCEATEDPGCAGCACEACVCEIDAFCCEAAWDASCVTLCTEDCGQKCGTEPPPPDSGCQESGMPGCGGCACETCVCSDDPYCCDTSWDSLCVEECDACGGNCNGVGPGGECAGNCGGSGPSGCYCDASCVDFGDCCSDACSSCGYCGGSTGYGCAGNCGGSSPDESCYCDDLCVSYGDCCSDACSECGFCPCEPDCSGKECGDDGCGGQCGPCPVGEACYAEICEVHCGNGECEADLGETCASCADDCGACELSSGCELLEQPSCGGCLCEACVCEADSFCCDMAWDSSCVKECLSECGGCGESAGCVAHEGSGCDGCGCEACVCEKNAYCCETAWDDACVVSCQVDCGSDCALQTCDVDLDCADGDPCTIDTCPEAGKPCHHEVTTECCSPAEGCDDSDDCTTDLCTQSGCSAAGHCCEHDTDCDDGDDCTTDVCLEGLCQNAVAADEACCDTEPLFEADFETELPFVLENESAAGGFNVTTLKANTGERSLWYGSKLTGDFDFGGGDATATSAPIALPPSYGLELTFSILYDTEYDADAKLEVIADGVVTEVWDSYPLYTSLEFEEQKVSLKAFGGKTVQLRFTVMADGYYYDSGTGVFFDSISIASDCYFPYCGDGICFDAENCYTCSDDCATPDDCPENTGCTAWEYPTCSGCECEECVCALDPACCDVAWDEACVASCEADCGHECANAGCDVSSGPTCQGCSCESCVCGMDWYCCEFSWDSICVDECDYDCGVDCTGGGGGGGGSDSCAGLCEEQALDGCWCDSACVSAGDCCYDSCSECGYCY